MADFKTYSLSAENFLLRGSILRNTAFIYGVVVYVGHNTKIMMNSTVSKVKVSRNERMLNK